MNIETIKNAISGLKGIYPHLHRDSEYNERIILTYSHRVLNDLEKITNDSQNTETLVENLKLYLEDNWNLVKGSLLSYTSLPNHDITLLLCDIAEYVAKENLELAAINALMPNVAFVSLLKPYPDLNKEDLRTVIKTHVLSENYSFLIPISLLKNKEISNLSPFPNVYFDYQRHDAASAYLSDEELNFLSNHSNDTKLIWDIRNQYKMISENQDTLLGQLSKLESLKRKSALTLQLIIAVNGALRAIQIKSEQLKKGCTTLFFKDISQKKQAILANIASLATNIIQKGAEPQNSNELDEIKAIIENNKLILKEHRGFVKFHETTSNQIAEKLINSLENLMTASNPRFGA